MTKVLPIVLIAVFGVCLMVVSAAAQDPLTVVPDAYRLDFENAWVKVVRVVYGPKAVIAPHLHTERASAYVYLNDGGPIVFRHEGLPCAAVTRPATTAGSFRVYKGLKEVHSVENPTDTPSEFLRVEFKTEPLDDAALKGKFYREDGAEPTTAQRVQFENAQIRITRVQVSAGDTLALIAHEAPALLVALSGADVSDTAESVRHLGSGRTVWLDPAETITIGGRKTPSEVLRFDFKTRPSESR
jgi:hypothetical protein